MGTKVYSIFLHTPPKNRWTTYWIKWGSSTAGKQREQSSLKQAGTALPASMQTDKQVLQRGRTISQSHSWCCYARSCYRGGRHYEVAAGHFKGSLPEDTSCIWKATPSPSPDTWPASSLSLELERSYLRGQCWPLPCSHYYYKYGCIYMVFCRQPYTSPDSAMSQLARTECLVVAWLTQYIEKVCWVCLQNTV